jgi:hypothetical protein
MKVLNGFLVSLVAAVMLLLASAAHADEFWLLGRGLAVEWDHTKPDGERISLTHGHIRVMIECLDPRFNDGTTRRFHAPTDRDGFFYVKGDDSFKGCSIHAFIDSRDVKVTLVEDRIMHNVLMLRKFYLVRTKHDGKWYANEPEYGMSPVEIRRFIDHYNYDPKIRDWLEEIYVRQVNTQEFLRRQQEQQEQQGSQSQRPGV